MQKAAEGPPPAARIDMAKRPDQYSAVVDSEQRILGRMLVDDLGEVRPGNGGIRTGHGFGVCRGTVVPVPLRIMREEAVVVMLREAGKQCVQGRLDIADRADRDRVPSANMGRIRIDLDDLGVVRIELAPGEIAPQKQQHVAIEDGVIARGPPDHAGHAHIVWIVVFDEILAA